MNGVRHLSVALGGFRRCGLKRTRAVSLLPAEENPTRPLRVDPRNGFNSCTRANTTAQVAQARDRGFRVEVHAIGDRALASVLDAFEGAGLTPEDRPIVTHCQVSRNTHRSLNHPPLLRCRLRACMLCVLL